MRQPGFFTPNAFAPALFRRNFRPKQFDPHSIQFNASSPPAFRSLSVSANGTTHKLLHVSPSSSTATTSSGPSRSPLFFIHGSFHSSWMWENFMTFFAQCGYTSYAIDLGSCRRADGGKVVMGEQVKDIAAILNSIDLKSPVMIGHSFGGMLVQRVIRDVVDRSFGGMVLVASTPPSGNDRMVWRTVRRNGLRGAWKITKGFALGGLVKDVDLCRELLFRTESYGECESDEVLKKYMRRFGESKGGSLDLGEVKRKLPMKGRREVADWLYRLPPTLVLGGSKDVIVDLDGVGETAKFYGTAPVILDGFPHDLMLCGGWEQPAGIIGDWLDKQSAGKRNLGRVC